MVRMEERKAQGQEEKRKEMKKGKRKGRKEGVLFMNRGGPQVPNMAKLKLRNPPISFYFQLI